MRRDGWFGLSGDNCLIALALFLWASGEGMFLYIQPLTIAHLGAGPVQIGLVLALDGAVRALSYMPGGMLADRMGTKRVMQIGWLVGALAAVSMSLAGDWRTFIPGVALYALSALCVPAISSHVAGTRGSLPLERALTLVFAAYSAGSVVSPALGGWLADQFGLRTPYIAAVVFFLISFLVVMRLPAATISRQRDQHVEGRRQMTLVWKTVQPLSAYSSLIFLAFLAMHIGQPLAPNFLRDTAGWTVTHIGALGSVSAVGITLLGPLLGRLGAGRRRRGVLLSQGLVWLSLGLLWIGARNVPGLVIASFFMRGGYPACRTLVGAQVAGTLPPASRGLAFGLVETVIAMAQMLAPYLAGRLYMGRPDLPIIAGLLGVPLSMALMAGLDALPIVYRMEVR